MEKILENDFNFKIEVDNENLLIVSYDNGTFSATAQYNKNYCRRRGITVEKINIYGDNPQIENTLSNIFDNHVKEKHSEKFM
jgi:hypothetical protein